MTQPTASPSRRSCSRLAAARRRRSPLRAASTGTTALHTPQGGGTTTANGEYVGRPTAQHLLPLLHRGASGADAPGGRGLRCGYRPRHRRGDCRARPRPQRLQHRRHVQPDRPGHPGAAHRLHDRRCHDARRCRTTPGRTCSIRRRRHLPRQLLDRRLHQQRRHPQLGDQLARDQRQQQRDRRPDRNHRRRAQDRRQRRRQPLVHPTRGQPLGGRLHQRHAELQLPDDGHGGHRPDGRAGLRQRRHHLDDARDLHRHLRRLDPQLQHHLLDRYQHARPLPRRSAATAPTISSSSTTSRSRSGTIHAGHWELRVDLSASAGDDINAIGVRAHDGTSGAGGTELPVYIDSIEPIGVNPPATGTARRAATPLYPYITSGCTASEQRLRLRQRQRQRRLARLHQPHRRLHPDDRQRLPLGQRRLGAEHDQPLDLGPDVDRLRDLDGTLHDQLLSINGNGINGNYTDIYLGNFQAAANPPTANPVTNSFRIYLPTDAGTAPVEALRRAARHLQRLRHRNDGPNPPVVGQTSCYTVTVRVANPTAQRDHLLGHQPGDRQRSPAPAPSTPASPR